MKKFYEVLRESFNVETLKNYRKVKTFDQLVDALVYARRYSKDCGGKRQFLQMLVFEIQPDDGDYAPLTADFLMHASEAKLIYKAEDDGVLHACDDEAEQKSASNESEEVDTTSASNTLYKGSDGKMYSVQEASYMAEGCRSWFACRCYHDAIYGKSWCKLHLVPFYNPSIALDYLKKYAMRNKIQLTKQNDNKTDDDNNVIDSSYEQGHGTAMCGGEEYILLNDPYEDNNSSGEAAFFARAVKVGDKFDDDEQVPCYKLEFKIIHPDWEDEGTEPCDWYEADDVSFDTYVYYNHQYGFCM